MQREFADIYRVPRGISSKLCVEARYWLLEHLPALRSRCDKISTKEAINYLIHYVYINVNVYL